ncbi:hypothetical protein ACOMICROBIO_GDFFDHBD_00918 [Vibrio sp. B1REV9]|uniref:carbohydrate-binding protein n=1 Tax=Vibrio sp. B1REV9 TaxID=2751179 RepID=UPI001AF35F7C|nr:carbohydrate-binding protein [Vibrio sp. B1REV9]CAE6891345.1 hypothetical protein ACOMICROBIO_GDFFDHBD_00918 [Vibrio sp. B1REV9]
MKFIKNTLLLSLLSASAVANDLDANNIAMDLLAGAKGVYNKNFYFSDKGNNSFRHLQLEAHNLPTGTGITIRTEAGDVLHHNFRLTNGEHQLYLPEQGGFIVSLTLPNGVQLAKDARLVIDKILYSQEAEGATERNAVGVDGRKRLACYQGAEFYGWGRSAIALNNNNLGSASSIGAGNLFLTNYHVIGEPRPINDTVALFNYRHSSCEGDNQIEDIIRLPVTEVTISGQHGADYSFFKVNEFDLINSEIKRLFGGLKLANKKVPDGSPLMIPQGYHKTIVASEHDDGNPCSILGQDNSTMLYNCDTEAGSSGSPVILQTTGELIGLHAAAAPTRNVGWQASLIHQQNPWLEDYAENIAVPASTKPVKLNNVAVSPFSNDGIVISSSEPVYFNNPKITMHHRDEYSLVYPQYLDEHTNEEHSAAELNLPIKMWLESKGKAYPINHNINDATDVTLKYESYKTASLLSRAWVPLDMYNAQGELIQHNVIRHTTNWFDAMVPPFDPEVVNADIEIFTINDFTKVTKFEKEGSHPYDGMLVFYPEQGPIAPTWHETHKLELPVVIENSNTETQEVAYITAYRWSCGQVMSLNSQATCNDKNAIFNFEFHPDKNRHLEVGDYSGILPLKIMQRYVDGTKTHVLMNIDISVPEMSPYSAVKLYSELDQSGEMVQLSANVADLNSFDFGNKLSSYNIPANYRVRFYEGTNFTGRYYTRDAGVTNASHFLDIVNSVEILTSPSYMKGPELSLIDKASYFPGQDVELDAMVKSENNISLSYQWQLPEGFSIKSGENSGKVVIATPKQAMKNQPVTLTVTDGKAVSTSVVYLSSTPSLAPTLHGISNITIEQGSVFDPLDGVSATDDLDGDVSASIRVSGIVNTDVAGHYELLYRAQDSEANVTELPRIITVESTDSSCGTTDPEAGKYPQWQSATVYTGGDIVSQDNLVWKAKYWTQGNKPSRTADQWQLISDVQLGWSKGVVYNGNDITTHNGRQWQAKWWTKGEEPGVASVWMDIGAASCQ